MKWTHILPNIRSINLISKPFKTNRRFTSDELPTWVEQSQYLMQRLTVYFLIITYSDPFLYFDHLSSCIFVLPTFISSHLRFVHVGFLFVTDSLSTSTITEPPSAECQERLIPTRSKSCVARIDLGFKTHSNNWYVEKRQIVMIGVVSKSRQLYKKL